MHLSFDHYLNIFKLLFARYFMASLLCIKQTMYAYLRRSREELDEVLDMLKEDLTGGTVQGRTLLQLLANLTKP